MTSGQQTVIKHPASAYLIVAFVALCVTAVVRSPVQALLYLIPIGCAIYVARTGTIVSEEGLTARAVFGSQTVAWSQIAGLRLTDSGAVYAVDVDGTQLRLPCIRSTKLQQLIVAADGRLPDLSR
jgi:hypothetical protein